MIEDKCDRLRGRISQDIPKPYDAWMSIKRFKDLNLPLDLTLLDRFKHLQHGSPIIINSHPRVYFRILALANLGDDLISLDIPTSPQKYPYSI